MKTHPMIIKIKIRPAKFKNKCSLKCSELSEVCSKEKVLKMAITLLPTRIFRVNALTRHLTY